LLKVFRRYETFLWDIVVFGSFTKDKTRPNDIDIAAVLRGGDLETVEKISSEIDKISDKIHFNWVFLHEIEKNPLWMTLMMEGFSTKSGKMLSEVFGYKTGVIFSYSLSRLENRSKFSHALSGRGKGQGELEESGGEMLAKGVVLVPLEKSDSFMEFLDYWKVDYRKHRVIIT
jgi:hypothetical protein